MKIFEELNNKFAKLLEGDVVSFADFKKVKEVEKDLEKASEEVLHANIKYVYTEGIQFKGVTLLEQDERADFKYFQTILYALDNAIFGDIQTEVDYVIVYELDGEELKHGNTIITKRDNVNTLIELEEYINQAMDKAVIFDGDVIPSNSEVQRKIIEIQKMVKNGIQANAKADLAPAKDYSNGGTKFGPDAEVGDILYYSFNYGSTQHYFLKIIERKGATIKLAALEKSTDFLNDDDGRVVPSNVVRPDNVVDGKTFRLHKSKADWDNVVCKVDGRYCYYWDGKPKRETYMD